jgi:hypothetical protein
MTLPPRSSPAAMGDGSPVPTIGTLSHALSVRMHAPTPPEPSAIRGSSTPRPHPECWRPRLLGYTANTTAALLCHWKTPEAQVVNLSDRRPWRLKRL